MALHSCNKIHLKSLHNVFKGLQKVNITVFCYKSLRRCNTQNMLWLLISGEMLQTDNNFCICTVVVPGG